VFRVYSLVSILSTLYLIQKGFQEHAKFYDRVVVLTSNKLNLVLLLNCVIVVLSNFAAVFVYLFFTQIRTLEAKVSALLLTVVVPG
jgi:hypothetical protein